ncbi:RICIN domain-containing protein [Spirillospora sp. NPDC048911]|uniref:RICIN domain-containing protein n=1 Tax=Spirillospora sp. NPDC048911 TaxID=3364527 RepID=UPI00371E32DF
MTDQLVAGGRYTVRGASGMLTMQDRRVVLTEPEHDASQQWDVAYEAGVYTFRNVATGRYLGDDRHPDEMTDELRGSDESYGWRLTRGEQDEGGFVLTAAASTEGLALGRLFIRMLPLRVGLVSGVESWALEPVG